MNTNQQVTGSYCGHKFSGVIQSMRALTVPTDGAFEFFVKLPQPIVVYGAKRDVLVLHTKFDGSPSSYTKHTDSMVAA